MRLYMMVTGNKEARQEMNQYLDLACKSIKAANNISSCFGQSCAKSFQCLKNRKQEFLIQELPKYSELFKRSNQLFRLIFWFGLTCSNSNLCSAKKKWNESVSYVFFLFQRAICPDIRFPWWRGIWTNWGVNWSTG